MSDQKSTGPAKPVPEPPRPWVPGFVSRLCGIAWVAVILVEFLPPGTVESLALLVGPQAAGLALLTCVVMLVRFRAGLFLLLMVLSALPAAYFFVVLRQFGGRPPGL